MKSKNHKMFFTKKWMNDMDHQPASKELQHAIELWGWCSDNERPWIIDVSLEHEIVHHSVFWALLCRTQDDLLRLRQRTPPVTPLASSTVVRCCIYTIHGSIIASGTDWWYLCPPEAVPWSEPGPCFQAPVERRCSQPFSFRARRGGELKARVWSVEEHFYCFSNTMVPNI